jgi:stage II sporulation protein AB (anti-sigma F factor)
MATILSDSSMEIMIEDYGQGIEDIEQAMEPNFSSDPDRTGLGFTLMKSFMDEMEINTQTGSGTVIRLKRSFPARDQEAYA